MNATRTQVEALTAGDVVNRDLVVVPRQMMVRKAVRLLHRVRASAAAVVDERRSESFPQEIVPVVSISTVESIVRILPRPRSPRQGPME